MRKDGVFLCLAAILATHQISNAFHDEEYQLERDEVIDAVNNANTTWQAGRNFHPSLTRQYSKILLGLVKDPFRIGLSELVDLDDDIDLPDTFDARDKWRDCVGLQTIRDQGSCGSCWAVSSASAFTDRLCIATKGQFNGQLSALDLMSCDIESNGCGGGDVNLAFQYLETNGIVTGGDYNSDQGCQPYPFPKCDHLKKGTPEYKPCTKKARQTPHCRTTCVNKDYYRNNSFIRDLHFIKTDSSFKIQRDGRQMQKELYRNGPLVAAFAVYEDFMSYKHGVYRYTVGDYKGAHAVKVIGWGVENGTDYWLVANSWNEGWGDKGFFKIRRGANECGFEEDMVGGIPEVHHGY